MTEPPATNVITIDGHAIEYRLQRRGGAAVLILHGGHMSACCRFGDEVFLETGYTVLVTSRPGYGRTGVGAGPSAPEFAVRLADLCRRLELKEVTVVGISIGARTALTMAAFYPDLVPNVILMCPQASACGRIVAAAASRMRSSRRASSERPGECCTSCSERIQTNTCRA